jgi:tRNA1Val (adenine37-N6)-methyltransferase
MPNPYFRFKEFTVYHDRCAMKVGTDGVLLGAWTNIENAKTVLDIGTGTGLIALMLAQRSNCSLEIDAIDIDEDAIFQAVDNIQTSGFKHIDCRHTSLQEYADVCVKKYDLIVSNPPYFASSLHSPDKQRTIARHTDSLSIDDFISISSRLLSVDGRLSIIFPISEKDYLVSLAEKNNLFVSRIVNVAGTPNVMPKRVLLEFSKRECKVVENNLIIEMKRHVYSDEFVTLVKDFYLKL